MEEFKELFTLLREYINKQRENMALGAAESMTRLFFVATTGLVLLLLSSTMLLLGSFALAFWINELTGSAITGFSAIAGVLLLLAIIIWLGRKKLILQPIAKLMVRIFLDSDQSEANNTSNPKR